MSSEQPTPTEQQLADWLAECDERLAAGDPASSIDTCGAPSGMAPRVLRDLECVELLRAVWPQARRQATADRHESATDALPCRIGRFEIRRELGQGGYGVVFLAFDPQLGREVALKIPRAEGLLTRDLRSRFQHEARIAAALDHPNIVPVYDAGELGPVCYIASAYCPGVSLAEWLQNRSQPVGLAVAAELVAMLADAVHHAHSRGVLHRDLKPGNIILCPLDESRTPDHGGGSRLEFIPRLTDFGLAKLIEAADQGHTRTHAVLGTPEYMSPEQAAGHSRSITIASDVYGLGVILYELLAGRPPFRAATSLATLRLVEKQAPVNPSRSRPGVPRDLETICLKCLEKEPARRYLTAHDLAADLRRYLAGEPVAARPAGGMERVARWCRRNPLETGLIWSIALVLVASTGLSTYLWLEALGRREAEIDAAVATVEAREAHNATNLAHEHLYLAKMLLAQSKWESVEMGNLAALLEATRPEHTLGADYRGFEWYYWQRSRHSDLATFHFEQPVYRACFSPDGNWLAVGGEAGKVWIVEAASGRRVRELSGHTGPVWGLSFNSRGDRLASGADDGTVRIWDARQGSELSILKGPSADVTGVAFSPDDRCIAAASEDHTVWVWDAANGAQVSRYMGHSGPVWNVAFDHDSQQVLSCGDDGVHIWRARSAEQIQVLRHDNPVYCADMSADGRRSATASEDGRVRIWDLTAGERVVVLGGHKRGVRWVEFGADGQLLSAARDGVVRLWDTAGNERLVLQGHLDMVDCAVFSHDFERIASASRDGTVKIWDARRTRQPRTVLGHHEVVESATFSADGQRIASVDRDGVVLVHDTETERVLFERSDHAGSLRSVAFYPNGRWLAVAGDEGILRIYDVEAKRQVYELPGHTGPVQALALSRDGRVLASAGADRAIHLWDSERGTLLRRLPSTAADIRGIAFSPDGQQLIAGGSDHSANVWDLEQGRIRMSLKEHTGPVYAVAFSPDGSRVATGGHDMSVRVWDSRDGRLLFLLNGHNSAVNGVAFSSDGRRLATASMDTTIKLWDMATGQELLTLKGHKSEVQSVIFSADDRLLLSAGMDHTVKLWDARPIDLAPETAVADK